MNRLEKRWFKSIVRREVVQGYTHADKICEMYKIIRDACEEEFMEDNKPTLEGFLQERFNEANKNVRL